MQNSNYAKKISIISDLGGNKMKERILEYLEKDARMSHADIATMLGITEEEVSKTVTECEENGTILNYRTMINWDLVDKNTV